MCDFNWEQAPFFPVRENIQKMYTPLCYTREIVFP
jgi:hypothetical protein